VDARDKEVARERHERFLKKHYRTRDEQRRIQDEARRRKAAKRNTSRGDEDLEDDDPDPFQKIRRVARRSNAAEDRIDRATIDAILWGERAGAPSGSPATVVAVHRTRLCIRPEEGDRAELDLPLPLSGPLPVVGDHVTFDAHERGQARLVSVAERRTRLARGDGSGGERVIAANVDLGVLVASVRNPELRPGLIDRVVVALRHGGVDPLVALNKDDLLDGQNERRAVEASLEPLHAADVPFLWVSAATGEGLDELRVALRNRTCVLVGHSGVGKTSLLNRLEPDDERATAPGRARDGKGRHTTSASCLVELADGTRLIDTPGVRSFALAGSDRAGLTAAFPDVAELAARCRFRDCSHTHEPECAVSAALEAGTLARARYAAYRRVADSLE